ncbi:hypothetical protein C8R46DRAFT_1213117 [Mycena filopes]|nr:hypothetical protein C8R46DRAFT_1213117 [Mycena filopes]
MSSTHNSLFSSPRPAPLPPTASAYLSPSPEGFVVPRIPLRDCPLRITLDERGHHILPHVSDHPLSVDHERVTRLAKYRVNVNAKCANCAEMAIKCHFVESGIPCPPSAVLGIPDCRFADLYDFMVNLADHRDQYLHEERATLIAAVKDNHLAPSQFDREYDCAAAWFYAAAEGAMTRFVINCHATSGLTLRGYRSLAASSTDAGLLSRFLAIEHESQMHPSVLQAVADRLQGLFQSFLS